MKKWITIAGALLLAGCAKRPLMNPINEINEPVFYPDGYAAVEANLGASAINGDEEETYELGPLLEPSVYHHAPVNGWASYSFLPCLWNFLLTGNQYADGSHLKTGKVHLSAELGINGVAYSERDGWEFSAVLGLNAKLLLSDRVFLRSSLQGLADHVMDLERGMRVWKSTLGYQTSPSTSVYASYQGTDYRPGWGGYYRRFAISFHEEDLGHEFRAGSRMYVRANHVFGIEGGYGFINSMVGVDDYYLVGLRYRYVFH